MIFGYYIEGDGGNSQLIFTEGAVNCQIHKTQRDILAAESCKCVHYLTTK
jgi:hypothetical protein